MADSVNTIYVLISFAFLILGGIVGWLLNQHAHNSSIYAAYMHPEMFDQNGNIIPDEILAVRFENEYDYYDDEEDDD